MDRRRWGIGPAGTALLLSSLLLLALPATSGAKLARGDLVVADAKAFGGGALIAVNPATGAESVLSSNAMPVNASAQLFDLPFTVVTNQAGEIFVANTANLGGSCNNGCGGVIKVDPETGAETVLSSNAMPINASSQYFHELTGIAVDPQGNILVTNWGGHLGQAEVIRVDPTTGKETLVSSNAMPVNASSELFAYPQGVIANAAGEIFVADALAFGGHGGIIGVNPATGKEREISSNGMPVNSTSQYFHAASQMAFNKAGNLLVADWCQWSASCGSIIEVNLQSGKETDASSNSLPVNALSEYFSETIAVAVNESGSILEIQEAGLGGSCEHGCGGLVSADPATGKETELSANRMAANSHTELFVEPFDVTVYGYTPSLNLGVAGSGQNIHPSPTPPASGSSSHLLIRGLAQSRRRWREPKKHHSAVGHHRPSTGTTFSFTLNEPAKLELEFTHVGHGRRVHGACRVARHVNRLKHSCSLTRRVGMLLVAGHAGRNTLAFSGLLARKSKLPPGSYRLTVRAVAGSEVAVTSPALHFVIMP
jgi:hypothetical protein